MTQLSHAALEQPPERDQLLLPPIAGGGDQHPPSCPPVAHQDDEPDDYRTYLTYRRLADGSLCPDCGQETVCSWCGYCHYCLDVDLPCPSGVYPPEGRRFTGDISALLTPLSWGGAGCQ
jgi:hypothetical protein